MSDQKETYWQEIDVDNLPNSKVLAANFKSGTIGFGEKLYGYLSDKTEIIACYGEHYMRLENITHYIDIEQVKFKERQP